jgi:hypothetical protein
MKQLRGPKHENWPVCADARAAPPGGYGLLKSGKNLHLARSNGAIDGPNRSPTWPSAFGRRCEPLAGRGRGGGGGFGGPLGIGGGAAPAPGPTRGAWGVGRGALLQIDWRIVETRGAQAVRRPGLARKAFLARTAFPRWPRSPACSRGPGGARGEKGERPLLFTTHKPRQMHTKQS